MNYDLCFAWDWEWDADLARLLEAACANRGLSLLQVTPATLDPLLAALESGETSFIALFDRASDTDPRFQPLEDWARARGRLRLNPQEQTRWAWDKATMHLEFISRGLHTPHTIILPPFDEQPEIRITDLGALGGRFVIKPAIGGGGLGVVLEATRPEQVHQARRDFPQEKILLQAHVEPVTLAGRTAWFRILACDGAVYPCWWDTQSHVYRRLGADESARLGLTGLRQVARRIAQVCRLDLFSTEVALAADGAFVITDYVNDPVDLRLQSKAVDGVPETIVEHIAGRLAQAVRRNTPHRE